MNTSIPTQFLNTNPNSKATFRPGGDAGFVSYLLGGIINEIADFGPARLEKGEDFKSYMLRVINEVVAPELAFSPALQAKFLRAAYRILDNELERQTKADVRAAKKANKAAAKAEVTYAPMGGHLAKKGRWTYPVAERNDGIVCRNTKVDGSGEWIPATDSVIIDA